MPAGDAHEAPASVLTRFYESYLRAGDAAARPAPAFSEAFAELLAENLEVCREIASPGDVCGFGADVDPFLDARGAKLPLDPQSARLHARDAGPGLVEVEFDLRPPERSQYHHRKIRYLMKIEKGRWVVDDIQYGARSARAQMLREIRDLRASIF